MKLKIFLVLILTLTFTTAFSKNYFENYEVINLKADSINVMVEASLFFEAYKNKQYDLWTLEKGLNVVKVKPDFMPKYTIYRKIDKVIWEIHDDSTTAPEIQLALADTAINLYENAIKYDSEYAGTYLVRKGYILDKWKGEPPEVSIAAYEEGLSLGTEIATQTYYMDQLGQLYKNNMNSENDYQIKALEIYSKLSEMEPDNARWLSMIESLAENDEELVEILKQAWYLDKDNEEKAWKYVRMCKRVDEYEKAIEPLTFLVEKNPDVVNYWNELARAYSKIGQTNNAISSYKKLINLQPDNRESYFNLALIYKDLDQLSVARSYLNKASSVSPGWDAPIYIEASLYEQAARNCGFEFEDKLVYQLAVDTYKQVQRMGGENAASAAARVQALQNSIPTKEDYFFRKKRNGDVIKIEGRCYDWIGKSITVSF